MRGWILLVVMALGSGCAAQRPALVLPPVQDSKAFIGHRFGDKDTREQALRIGKALAEAGWKYTITNNAGVTIGGGLWLFRVPDNKAAIAVEKALADQGLKFKVLLRKTQPKYDLQVWVAAE